MKNGKIVVKVYFNLGNFTSIAKDAEKAGKRRGGLQLLTQAKNGFSDQKVANTDGISKFLKMCWQYYREQEPARLKELAELAEKEEAVNKRKKELGA